MSVSIRISRDVLFLDEDDDVALEEWSAALEEARARPDYRPGMGVVQDWRTRSTALTRDQAAARADYMGRGASASGPTRWAIVVGRDVDFGMGRMIEALLADSGSLVVRVFRDPSDAEAWAREKNPPTRP